jgi:hypothetical protein
MTQLQLPRKLQLEMMRTMILGLGAMRIMKAKAKTRMLKISDTEKMLTMRRGVMKRIM